ncbi:MAG: WecB/TagA/CpsF family glycosyltransferase, partial [Candidatus Moranbacteria bacterium]|nr:WecB/TagA/CpsF family glycosyltransferase [Candidatus Moranbacteria bacterium]
PSNIRLVMGVGGSFDHLTGRQQRAPNFLRIIGLEWLWRFVLQPWRIKRIWNAVIVFPLLVFLAWQKDQKKL